MVVLYEKGISIQETSAGQPKIKNVRRDQGERLTQTLLLCHILQVCVSKKI